jgi:DnaJ-class molecular chaperone|tara:strand:+ start:348 stop:629 length:282 start_codon:yes stop_codon:yes gene_type:complete
MTDKQWRIVTECPTCNGYGKTEVTTGGMIGKDRTPWVGYKDMTCTECEGRGTKCYLEPRYKYKSGNEVRRDYQNVKELELINISWGSPTISME